jgi:hypothetical protein
MLKIFPVLQLTFGITNFKKPGKEYVISRVRYIDIRVTYHDIFNESTVLFLISRFSFYRTLLYHELTVLVGNSLTALTLYFCRSI